MQVLQVYELGALEIFYCKHTSRLASNDNVKVTKKFCLRTNFSAQLLGC